YVERGHELIVVSPEPYHYYSGMGPGMVSGIYDREQGRLPVAKLTEQSGGRFIADRVTHLDAESRRLELDSNTRVSYDVVSFNTGSIIPRLPGSSAEDVFPVKPIENMVAAREGILNHGKSDRATEVLVVGGGPAGVEAAANVRELLDRKKMPGNVTLVCGKTPLKSFPEKARKLGLDSLLRRNVRLVLDARVERFKNGTAVLSTGQDLNYDSAFLAIGIKPSEVFKSSQLPLHSDGSLLVNDRLQSIAAPEVFGGGDCVWLKDHSLARVGFHAVKQGQLLARNLLKSLEDNELEMFHPRTSYLLILNLGNGTGVTSGWGMAWNGHLAFWLKNLIDRRFVRRFQNMIE
ncbi:MAG: FAD-dependent oxidoreductase, partial [Planctomycetes bacterium]|nr:FAD-dependent oxidoreductase [Planctomycetota bacterium]